MAASRYKNLQSNIIRKLKNNLQIDLPNFAWIKFNRNSRVICENNTSK